MIELLERDIERFWSHVNRRGENDCWEWTAALSEHGYGHFNLWRNGKTVNLKAHRVAWQIVRGPIPDGLFACHSCDNPRCVNPKHLFLGTQDDNMADMARKGRNLDHRPRVKGEGHPLHKLSSDDVAEIRRVYAAGGVTQRELGKRFGVSQARVQMIVTGKGWRYTQ